MKTCIILRGLPGSGKTTIARYLESVFDFSQIRKSSICCTDDYFMFGGEYCFDATKLARAHEWNFDNFCARINYGTPLVIVPNTSTRRKEFIHYKEYAEKHGYRVFVLTVENYHNSANVHGVPETTVEKMRNRFSIKL